MLEDTFRLTGLTYQTRGRILCNAARDMFPCFPGSGDSGDVISHPTAATKCSICWVVHEVKQSATHPCINRDLFAYINFVKRL